MVYCPECETDLDIEEDEVDEGAVVSCPECGTDFEVITSQSHRTQNRRRRRGTKWMTTKKTTTKTSRMEIPEARFPSPDPPERLRSGFRHHSPARRCWPSTKTIAGETDKEKPYALIFGTVWDPEGHAVYGVRVKIRRADAEESALGTLLEPHRRVRPKSACRQG